MIASDLLRADSYAFIATPEEYRTSEFKEKLITTLDEESKVGRLAGIIFINKLPQTSNGKVSMEVMRCLLNKMSLSHMAISNQDEIETI